MSNNTEDYLLIKSWVSNFLGITNWKVDYASPFDSITINNPDEQTIHKLYASLDLFGMRYSVTRYNHKVHPYKKAGDLLITLGGTNKIIVWFDYFL